MKIRNIYWVFSIGLFLNIIPTVIFSAGPPSMTISSGGPYSEPAEVSITVKTTGGDGGVSHVDIKDNDASVVKTCSLMAPQEYVCDFKNVSAPGHWFTATAYDNNAQDSGPKMFFVSVDKDTPIVTLRTQDGSTSYLADPAVFTLATAITDGPSSLNTLAIYEGGVPVPGCYWTSPSLYITYYCSVSASVGTHTYQVEASNTLGHVGYAFLTVTVASPLPKMSAFFSDSPNYMSPATIKLTATAKNGIGGIKTVKFKNKETGQEFSESSDTGLKDINKDTGGKVICSTSGADYSCTLTKVPMGTWTFDAKAYDNASVANVAVPSASVKVVVTCTEDIAHASGVAMDCICFSSRTTHFAHYPGCMTCATTCTEAARMYAYLDDCVPWVAGTDKSGIEEHLCGDDSVTGGVSVSTPVAPKTRLKPPWDAARYAASHPAYGGSPGSSPQPTGY